MATQVRVRDLCHQPSDNVLQEGNRAIAELTEAVQALADKLDADASVADDDYRDTIDAIMLRVIVK